MQKTILTSVFTLLIVNCIAQVKMWESLKVNNEIEILFPEKYTSSLVGDKVIYRCRLADSTATLTFIESDLSAAGLTAAQMDEQATTEKFWQDYVPAMLNQVPDVQLITTERKNIGCTQGALITYKKGDNILHQLHLVKGLKTYIITFNSRGRKGDNKLKEAFFEKIMILK